MHGGDCSDRNKKYQFRAENCDCNIIWKIARRFDGAGMPARNGEAFTLQHVNAEEAPHSI